MAKDDVIELEGIVTDALPNAMFKVNIGGGHTILAVSYTHLPYKGKGIKYTTEVLRHKEGKTGGKK